MKKSAYQEDEYLREFYSELSAEKNAHSFWEKVASKMRNACYSKSPKQCRERWLQHLDPSLTNLKWSPEENKLLLDLQKTNGNKWKDIAVHFPQRTDNGIKNQFFSIIRKSLRKAFKASGVNFSTNLINNLKPKILSDFLDTTINAESLADSGQPTCSIPVRVLIERFTFHKMSEITASMSKSDMLLISEALHRLQKMK